MNHSDLNFEKFSISVSAPISTSIQNVAFVFDSVTELMKQFAQLTLAIQASLISHQLSVTNINISASGLPCAYED